MKFSRIICIPSVGTCGTQVKEHLELGGGGGGTSTSFAQEWILN